MYAGTIDPPADPGGQNIARVQNYARMSGMSAEIENPITYTTFNSWSQCSNNVILHYIGHGSPNGIRMTDGRVWTGSNANLHDNTVLMSVSCNGYHDPYKQNVIDDGAQVFMSGVTTLGIGVSEECSSAYLEDAIDCTDLISAYYNHIQGYQNCEKNQEWGFFSDGTRTLKSPQCGNQPNPAPAPSPVPPPVPRPVPSPVPPPTPSGDCFSVTDRNTCLATTDAAGHECLWCTDTNTHQHICTYTNTERRYDDGDALKYYTCETRY